MANAVRTERADRRSVPSRITEMRIVIVSTIFLLALSSPFKTSWGADSDKLRIDLDTAKLHIFIGLNAKFKRVNFGGKFFQGIYHAEDWQLEQYTLTQYHIRHKSWKDFFWNIDCNQKKIWRMKGSNLKAAGTAAIPLDDIAVNVEHVAVSRNGEPVNRAQDVQNEKDAIQMLTISLTMRSPKLFLDQQTRSVFVTLSGAIISDTDAWKVRRVSKDIYQFQLKRRPFYFWQIDLPSMSVAQITGGNFGFLGGRLFRLPDVVSLGDDKLDSQVQSELTADFSMARYRGNHPKSAWQESEKALNTFVLSRSSYDVLVVPFQVSGYAIDRIDRSLMTRYLVQQIELSTRKRLPSPTLVARALGDNSRTFDDYDVFQLANKLGVKQILRGYVGHDLNEKMSIILVVQTRNGQEYFSPSTKTVRYSWKDIDISDEKTPAEAFSSVLYDISARLQLPKVKGNVAKTMRQKGLPKLPSGIEGLVVNGSSPPIVRAYYLQLLGMLHPEQSVTKEQLFERSLVALRQVSPRSSVYKVLKARALFYLYRRPAALAVMGVPKNAEEKALSAVLDGNLQLLNESLKDIKGPLPRLIAQIERSDLLWRYSPDQARSESVDNIMRQWPGWEKILDRRLSQQDGWNIQSNLDVKKELDRLFPIAGFTSKDILKRKITVGELPMDDVDFSVYNHYRRMMENQPKRFVVNESTGLVERDVLDLMTLTGEANLLKKIRLRRMQALFDEMVTLVDRYSAIYGGHPEMSFLKAFALYRIADSKRGQIQKNFREEANKIQSNVCYWSQGQTEIDSQRSCSDNNFYDADYPRRWFWKFSNDPRALADRKYRGPQKSSQHGSLVITPFDRKELMNYRLSLLYTQTDFSILSSYYDKLRRLHMFDEAAALVQKNRQRFIGNPSETSFFADLAEKEGDVKRARSIYKEAIMLKPNDWAPYYGLSSLLIRRGDFKNASKTALRYPLFSNADDRRENSPVNTVALSNHAFDIGSNLWWRGAIEEAKPLLQLSAGYDTGSGAEMWSTTFLALLDHRFEKAARMSLMNAKRYNIAEAYGNYMELLHVMGYHDEAWSVLPLIQGTRYGGMNWNPVLIGLRMEGKTEDEQIRWLKKQPANSCSSQDAATFSFLVHALDRKPDRNLSKKMEMIRQEIETAQSPMQTGASQKRKRQSSAAFMPEAMRKRFADPTYPFADGYALLKNHQFLKAYEELKGRFLGDWIRKKMFSFAIPYLAWSAAKSGKASEVESYLAEYKDEMGDDFDYYLSMAFLSNGKSDHGATIKNLESARYHADQVNGMRLFPTMYQLAEACEWLYGDSKFEGYRDLLLKLVKLRQTIRPMDSWAYAFEAKYTKSDADRIRTLAITLYLDKQSERISHLSEREKSKARKWLKENNLFLPFGQKASDMKI